VRLQVGYSCKLCIKYSRVAGTTINDEEDVLHVVTLPTWGKLTQSASELLISYLTAPYLRVPLVLDLFARPEHIHALSVSELQASDPPG